LFDRKRLNIKALSERKHDLDISFVKKLVPIALNKDLDKSISKIDHLVKRLVEAKKNKSSIILMMGGHVIRSGTQRYLIDLMEQGYISCIAMNGSCIIHDFELSLIGATTESVPRYIKTGEFGLWKETAQLNDIINNAYKENNQTGMGKAVGKAISESDYPHKDLSLLANAYNLGIPATVHVGIGHDIIHEHPNCDGAATGALSYNDFLQFASAIENLEGGVVMNFGSAVMAPEVYLKALSMARNVAHQSGKEIKDFCTLVCDLHDLPETFGNEPSKNSAEYYFRPWKTMLIRTVADGGESIYIKGQHQDIIPALWSTIYNQKA